MKLAWIAVVALAGVAVAESQAEIAARLNQDGVALMEKGKYDDAAARFREAVARVPEPKYFFNLCVALFQTGKFGEALSACTAVGKNQPPADLAAKTDKLIQKIKDEAAAQHISLVDAATAARAAKANEAGKDLLFKAKNDEARAKFMDAVALDPQGLYLFNLCTADFLLGKFGEALDACKRVAATHPAETVQSKTDKMIVRIRAEAKAQHINLD
jgi:tetratricopeptide (TPR) repeat protein